MLARLMTWVFYAVVFFLLGAWVGGFSLGLRALMREGAQEAQVGGEIVWRWARITISEARAPAPGAAEPTAKDLLQSPRAAFARGDIDQSISLYQELLKKEPGDVDARGEFGNVLFGAGRLQEASRTYYETALRLAQASDGERARALEPIIRRNAPQLADRLENELNALAVSGNRAPTPRATEAMAKDLLRSPRAALARGDVNQSISLYQELLKKEPDDAEAHGELGNVLLKAGRLQEASQSYYDAALRLARAGDGERARALEPIIRRNAPQLADRLENELKALAVSGKRSALVSSRDGT